MNATSDALPVTREVEVAAWKELVARFQYPDRLRATWQIVNTFGAYIGVWVAMYFALAVSWWLVIPLAILAAGLLIRVFIIFHDCGHGSFYASRTANDVWGFIAGVLTFTPYYHWRWEHSIHHASAGNLDRRGVGDVWTMTVDEYLASPWRRRMLYRLARHPVGFLVFAPIVLFVIVQRFPVKAASRRERHSVFWMNAALLAVAVGMSALFGVVPYLVIQGTVTAVAGAAGVWLFYVQHQFEDAYWERGDDWGYADAALRGSSFYKLPKVLQWFSGNIGFHHIHHLSPRIPNYNLERCHRSDPLFQTVTHVTLLSSLRTGTLRLWDESTKKLVGFRRMRELRERRAHESEPARSAPERRSGV
ncbi:MAG: fatty acid desaturase [Planctomycetes bacterium]|nr:fatty acid desaturase [Planctomycetota bacterium]